MIRLLQWLLCGHVHKWKTLYKNTLTNDCGEKGERYVQECETCGKVIKRDLI